jgi:hypothetical protein
LVGTWKENTDRQLVIEFAEDGAIAVDDERLQKVGYAAKWILLDDEHMEVTFVSKYDGYGCATNRVAIVDDRLFITDVVTKTTTEHARMK